MIAVAGLVPMIVAGLYGGMLADAFDRRRVALIAATVTFASTALLAVLTWAQLETVWWLYALSIVNSAANTIVMAARQAIVPRLIPRELLPAASALNGITVGIMVMAGPALAGVLVAFAGYAWTYTIDVVLMMSLFLGLWTLPSIRPEGDDRPARTRVAARRLAVPEARLEHPAAVHPRHHRDDLRSAARALPRDRRRAARRRPDHDRRAHGIRRRGRVPLEPVLRSGRTRPPPRARHRAGDPRLRRRRSPRSAWCSGRRRSAGSLPPTSTRRTPNLVLIVAAALTLVVAGGADNVSSIFRNTMVQAAVPDAIRGRLQGVFIVVVAGGPRARRALRRHARDPHRAVVPAPARRLHHHRPRRAARAAEPAVPRLRRRAPEP